MKAYMSAALSVAFATCAASAWAQSIVTSIQAPPTLAAWSTRVMTGLNKGIRVRDDMGAHGPSEGIVAVKFNCSESGAPDKVELLKSSGNREYDRATLQAVRRIASLHPLPKGLGHDQKYILRMLFSSSESEAQRKLAEMRRDAERSNAWYMRAGTINAAIELAPVG